MEITEVRIKLMEDSDDRLQAFCSVTFDNAFVVRDLKIIDGTNGPFVAMPSRKLTSHCHQCGSKNHLKASYCNQCGARQRDDRLVRDAEGRAKLYADIAHPINSICRDMIQRRVVQEFQDEMVRARIRSNLRPGFEMTRGTALHLALMSSENRAAQLLGRTYPGGLSRFVEAMNAKARLLGMDDSHFADPTGLSAENRSSGCPER